MQSIPAHPAGVRLAVIGTPRSGNTWLRRLLAHAVAAEELAVHHPADVDWAALPTDCVLQLHWPRDANLEAQLAWHGFRVVVLARHPLDVLLSILHFATHDGATRHWLQGAGGDEKPILGAMPCSAPFLEYAQGTRASALLAVSAQWQSAAGAVTLTYENLVANPAQELERVLQALGALPRRGIAQTVSAATLSKMRSLNPARHHFWQGRPGHWKRLLIAEIAERIAASQAPTFQACNYLCDPDRFLTQSQADALWIDLNRDELIEKTWNYTATRRELEKSRLRLEMLQTGIAGVARKLADVDRAWNACEGLHPESWGPVREMLCSCRDDLDALQSTGEPTAGLWKSKFLRLGRSLAHTARRVLRRSPLS